MVIVPDNDVEEINYGTTTPTSTTQSMARQEDDEEENIVPIAYLYIKLDSTEDISATLENDILSLLSIDSLELTNIWGEKIEIDTEEPDESELSPPSASELLQSYPNPAGDSCYIPFN